MRKISILFTFFLFIYLFSCSRDQFEPAITDCEGEVTYDNQLKAIIDETCAYTGCHDGGGEAPGDYSSFERMSRDIQSGRISNRVINLASDPDLGMPPDYAVLGPIDLTEEQFQLFSCWIEEGYKEN